MFCQNFRDVFHFIISGWEWRSKGTDRDNERRVAMTFKSITRLLERNSKIASMRPLIQLIGAWLQNFSSFQPSVWPGSWMWFEIRPHILWLEETITCLVLQKNDEWMRMIIYQNFCTYIPKIGNCAWGQIFDAHMIVLIVTMRLMASTQKRSLFQNRTCRGISDF